MAFVGYINELSNLPQGEYYEVVDTGEVFDSENDLDEYGWVWYPHSIENSEPLFTQDEVEEAGLDEDKDGEWLQEPFTVNTFVVEPVYITLQNDPWLGEEFVWMYNVNRGFDNIPPDTVGKVYEADTWDEAIEEAERLASELSRTDKYIDEPVGVTAHTNEAYGDVYEVYINGRPE